MIIQNFKKSKLGLNKKQHKVLLTMTVLEIFFLVIAIVFILDLLTFIWQSLHSASNFTYYICRPLWGLISGKSIGMVIGFIIRLVECGAACILMDRFLF